MSSMSDLSGIHSFLELPIENTYTRKMIQVPALALSSSLIELEFLKLIALTGEYSAMHC